MLLLSVGSGARQGSDVRCRRCQGTGVEVRVLARIPGVVHSLQSTCSDCNGQGECIRGRDQCRYCDGRKVVREKKILTVHIDKGWYSHLQLFCTIKRSSNLSGLESLCKILNLGPSEHFIVW